LILNAAYSPPLKAFVDLDKPVRQASHDHNYVNCHCIGRSVPRCLQVSAKVSLELFGGQIFVVKEKKDRNKVNQVVGHSKAIIAVGLHPLVPQMTHMACYHGMIIIINLLKCKPDN